MALYPRDQRTRSWEITRYPRPGFRTVFKAYLLSDYLGMPELQNYIIKFMNDRVAEHKYVLDDDFA